MSRKKCLDLDTIRDHVSTFFTVVDQHRTAFTGEEISKLRQGLEQVHGTKPIEQLIRTFKNLILNWLTEWKRKAQEKERVEKGDEGDKGNGDEEPNKAEKEKRRVLLQAFPTELNTLFSALSLCDTRELSGSEERKFDVLREYLRGQIRRLTEGALEQSEDLHD